tara:strand:+ start:504 stop:893 length:390 start_codon:yes stop_codon:yes gene_type:complete
MSYKVVRLQNGEDLLTELVGETRDFYNVRNPWLLSRIPTGVKPSEAYLAFSEWNPYTNEKDFSIAKKDVLIVTSCKQEIVDFYNQLIESKSGETNFRSFDEVMAERREQAEDSKDYMQVLKDFDSSDKH